MEEETIRVLRFLEYVGPRDQVEASLVHRTVKGTKHVKMRPDALGGWKSGTSLTIREGFIGEFPEIWSKWLGDK